MCQIYSIAFLTTFVLSRSYLNMKTCGENVCLELSCKYDLVIVWSGDLLGQGFLVGHVIAVLLLSVKVPAPHGALLIALVHLTEVRLVIRVAQGIICFLHTENKKLQCHSQVYYSYRDKRLFNACIFIDTTYMYIMYGILGITPHRYFKL